MTLAPRAALRALRYAAPEAIGRVFPVESGEAAAKACARLAAAQGMRVTLGYFALPEEDPDEVAEAFIRTARALKGMAPIEAALALKAAPLGFDRECIARIANEGIPLILDSLTPEQAPQTLALAEHFDCGIALPARWRRSATDAAQLRERPCRIRLVKGEWGDPVGDPADLGTAYLALVRVLAGRRAPVEVATHDPWLAEAALAILGPSGTPVELGQLRGLPRRRTNAVAVRHSVPLRFYYPFGPGWWPYAFEQALRKPYLPLWVLRDRLAR